MTGTTTQNFTAHHAVDQGANFYVNLRECKFDKAIHEITSRHPDREYLNEATVLGTYWTLLEASVVWDGEAASAAQSLRTSASKASKETCSKLRAQGIYTQCFLDRDFCVSNDTAADTERNPE